MIEFRDLFDLLLFRYQVLLFSGNLTSHREQIQILFNKNRKMRRAFNVYITSDMASSSGLGRKKTVVFIEKAISSSSVTFPLTPKVVSLRHYDNVNGFIEEIPLGYPLVCVTVRTSTCACIVRIGMDFSYWLGEVLIPS
jgi:hypothetical protein